MAFNQTTNYSPGNITQSVYDEDNNALQVSVVASSEGALSLIETIYLDYSSTNVTTSAYVELSASLPGAVSQIEIFDSSGSALVLATGAAASEVNNAQIFPGGNGLIPAQLNSGVRLSIKALDADATSGILMINLYG